MNNSQDNRAGLRSMLAVLCVSLLLAVPAGAQGWKDWAWWPISGGTQPDVITSPFGIRNSLVGQNPSAILPLVAAATRGSAPRELDELKPEN